MPFPKYTAISTEKIETQLNSNLKVGLSSEEAQIRLQKNGPNMLKTHQVTWGQILKRQFKSAFVYLLVVAALVSFFWGEHLDGIFILLFVLINASLGFYQEFKSEQTVKLLKSFVQPKVKVIRNGEHTIVLSQELVVGDIVVLETGDIIPADLRIINENGFTVDESVLTGESLQVKKNSLPLSTQQTEIYKASNMVFMGTSVVNGSATGIVIGTSEDTEMGKITKLTGETTKVSGFEKQINNFSKFILYLIVGTLLIVFVAHLFLRTSISIKDLALFSITLAVGVVPEALPLVTTFSLSRGAINLTKKKVVVKRLSAIEDLGSIEILCSDKTGTLTENKLKVSDIYSMDIEKTLFYGLVASTITKSKVQLANNSFDIALENKVEKNVLEQVSKITKITEVPFDPARRRNSVLIKKDDTYEIVIRGAAENILPFVTNIDGSKLEEINKWIVTQGIKGHRVISVAIRENYKSDKYTIDDEQHNLKLLGLISFLDPVKKSTKDAVERAKILKVAIKILTGDSKEVAGAVAYQVGIASSPKKVLTGEEFNNLSPRQQLEAVMDYSVFARVSPEQKYKIIELLQRSHQVGYLGEGINDAPALKIANVALVVDKAADIAREAADIVLLSSNLDVIINGIEEGRKTFVNTVKYIKSTLTSNFGNFYSVAFASLLIDYLPMLPIQILLVNLLSDFPMISIATDTVDLDEMKNPKNYDIKEIVLIATILGTVSSLFDFLFFGVFKSGGEKILQTNWFIGSILTELLLIYSIRTKGLFFKSKNKPSWQVSILTLVAGLSTILIPLTPVGQRVFGFISPSINNFLVIFGLVVTYFVCTELAKLAYYKKFTA